ncbi:MAG TPA: c-type cytochrome [Gaiellaceae bacterium]|nr:c-type cytochrome [Gaiellaceae bacterium]
MSDVHRTQGILRRLQLRLSRRSTRLALAVALTVTAMTALGLSLASARPVAGDPVAGKSVFASAGCGGCHTFAAAGSSGSVGPNLDVRKPSFTRVVSMVTNGSGVMPSFRGRLTSQQIQDVAAFVSGTSGGATPPTATGAVARVRVVLREWKITARPTSVRAGRVRFVVRNAGKLRHVVAVARSVGRPIRQRAVAPGATVKMTVVLKAGRVVIYAAEPGKDARRLRRVITVRAAMQAPPSEPLDGKGLFQSFCGGCHTLAAAGTTGRVGPDLDDEGKDCDEVLEAIVEGEGDGRMPSFAKTLTAEQRLLIARFVATATGQKANCP